MSLLRLLMCLSLCGAMCAAASGAQRAMRFRASTPERAREWQAAAREKLFSLMMGGARPAPVPLDVEVLQHIEVSRGGYGLEEVTLQTLADRRAHAWVAIPRAPRGKVPAVLALHGHGGSGEQVVLGDGLYWYGRALAEMGYAVIAPDIGSHDLQHDNWTLMGERAWDALCCVDYILGRPEVARKDIAVAGLSLGGETAMYVAALDERVTVVDSSGWLTTVANMKNRHCPCWQFPGLEDNFDFADIFACVAPRPLICEIGEKETAPGGFPASIARRAFGQIQRAYRAFDAEDRAVLDIHPEGHVFIGRELWEPLRSAMGTPYPWRASRSADDEALRRGEIARRAFSRALGVLDGWWALRDPRTDLFPRRLDQNVWAPNDNAADMLPFLYLTAHFLCPERTSDISRALASERALTNRLGVLPDWYDIAKGGFVHEDTDIRRLIFGAAEYCKDGLLPMTEVMDRGPWTERMIELVGAIFERAPVKTDFGMLPADDAEVNGDLLQVLCRLYAMTGESDYLTWAERIGDAYCLEVLPMNNGLPAHRWDFEGHRATNDALSLNDHGNEIVGGLSELMVASQAAGSEKAAAYARALKVMFDRLLEKGRNSDGIWFSLLKSSTGEVANAQPPDTWGYALTGAATFGMATGDQAMKGAVIKALRNIDQPEYLHWRGADSYADAIEGALLLLNRYPERSGLRWLEKMLPLFLARQRADGIVEGWYGDGNYARTALMAGLYYTQGVMCRPWRDDLRFGAVRRGEELHLTVAADDAWRGRLVFDTQRHQRVVRLPFNYPRLNEFPEWFTADPTRKYRLSINGRERIVSGAALSRGIGLGLAAGRKAAVTVRPQ
ncbi:MAG: acetylxylan esterase [Armatimonadota bacterium]|nr:MAG: acetylxylan esterase [Armatimonadota bacterium]